MEFLFTILVTCSQLRFACGWWLIRQRSWTVQKWQKPSPMCQPRRCGLQGNSNVARWEDVKKSIFLWLFVSFSSNFPWKDPDLLVRLPCCNILAVRLVSWSIGWLMVRNGHYWNRRRCYRDFCHNVSSAYSQLDSCWKLDRFAWMIAPNDCKAADSLMVEGMPPFFALAMACHGDVKRFGGVMCLHDENLRVTPPMPPPQEMRP